MRQLIILFTSLLFCVSSFAQDDDVKAATKQINTIKSSNKYIYAESTTAEWQEAYENAKAILEQRIDEWVKSENKAEPQGYIAKSGNSIFEVKTKRGNLFRAFIYVKKSDIITYDDNQEILGSQAATRQIDPEQSIVKDHPLQSTVDVVYVPTDKEKLLMQLTAPESIGLFVKNNAAKYGKISELPASTDCYVVIWGQKRVEQYLHCLADGSCINLATGKTDLINNYNTNGRKALWLIMK